MTTILIFCLIWAFIIVSAACIAAHNGDSVLASRNSDIKPVPPTATSPRPARRRSVLSYANGVMLAEHLDKSRNRKLGRLLHANNAVK